MTTLHDADYELLSAYLDNELSPEERAALERRLLDDAGLREALETLRVVQLKTRNLPLLKAPRDFTLDPARYRRTITPQRIYRPRYQWASAVSAIAAVLVMAIGVLTILQSSGSFTAMQMAPVLENMADGAAQSQVAVAPTAMTTPTAWTAGDEATAGRIMEAQPSATIAQQQALSASEVTKDADAPVEDGLMAPPAADMMDDTALQEESDSDMTAQMTGADAPEPGAPAMAPLPEITALPEMLPAPADAMAGGAADTSSRGIDEAETLPNIGVDAVEAEGQEPSLGFAGSGEPPTALAALPSATPPATATLAPTIPAPQPMVEAPVEAAESNTFAEDSIAMEAMTTDGAERRAEDPAVSRDYRPLLFVGTGVLLLGLAAIFWWMSRRI